MGGTTMNNEEFKRLYEDYQFKSPEELKTIALDEDDSFTLEARQAARDVLHDAGVLLEESTVEEKVADKKNAAERITSTVGQAIKIFAVLFLFLAIAGIVAHALLVREHDGNNVGGLVINTLAYVLVAVFGFALTYGFGEIIDRLASIDTKLEK